jgi:transposase
MEITTIGIDIAKLVFQVHGANHAGKAVLTKRLYRGEVLSFMRQQRPCLVGMEACCGAHHWARELRKLGHEVKLISPQFVKPYVKSNKNDKADAEAICEAVTRPSMRYVPVKSIEQQDLLALHRVRERLIKARTALCNEVRGLLMEYGITISQGVNQVVKQAMPLVAENDQRLTAMMRETLNDLLDELAALKKRIAGYEKKLKAIAEAHPVCQRLTTVPGVGPISATAVMSSVGDASAFKNGRQFAAWLGLVPRQHSSGGKERLLGISKRGDGYIRRLLVHGARSVINVVAKHTDRQSMWVKTVKERRGTNRTVVALANKNARVLWVLMTKEKETYKRLPAPAQEAA